MFDRLAARYPRAAEHAVHAAKSLRGDERGEPYNRGHRSNSMRERVLSGRDELPLPSELETGGDSRVFNADKLWTLRRKDDGEVAARAVRDRLPRGAFNVLAKLERFFDDRPG
jgi:hypothetical protein